MRKSFTRLTSVLVLLMLSVQLSFGAITYTPADGGTTSSTQPTFTINFGSAVTPVMGYTVGLYTDGLGTPMKVIQLTAATVGTDVTVNGSVVTFSFSGITLSEQTNYDVLIEQEAFVNADGDQFITGGDFVWDFMVADLTAPTLATTGGLSPADGANGVAVTADAIMTFTEPVMFVAGYTQELGDFAIYKSTSAYDGEEGGDLVSTTMPAVSIVGNVVTIDWDVNLDPATDYYVRVKGGILEDAAGHDYAGINTNIGWNFTTKAAATITPVIAATETPLWTSSNFTVTFPSTMYISKNVVATAANVPAGTFMLTDQDGSAVPFDLSLAGNVFTLNPKSALVGSSFTVTVAASQLRDVNNNLNGAKTATFNAGDWFAPVIESLTTTNHSGTTFDILVETDEVCVVKYIVVREGTPAATLEDVLGYDKAGANQNHATTPTHIYRVAMAGSPGALDYGYSLKSGSTWTNYEIMAEGEITVSDPSLEVLERVLNLPATNGADYVVYAAAYDASVSGVYNPDYSGIAAAAAPVAGAYPVDPIAGNISGVSSADGLTIDILMPTVWFDADSAGYNSILLNKLKEDGATAPEPMGEMARKAIITLNFNEGIRMADGTAIDEDDVPLFLDITDGGTSIGYSATITPDMKQIIVVPDSAYKSGSTVVATIAQTMIEDLAGNEFQPSDVDLRDQGFLVETYNPVLIWYDPETAETEVDGNCISVSFDKLVYVPRVDEPTQGDMKELSNVTTSPYWVGKYFEVREGDGTGASALDPSVKDEFEYTVTYTDTETNVEICRTSGVWGSETWYYVQAESELLDENRYALGDGAGITGAARPAAPSKYNDETTDTNDNQTVVFQYEDTRAPEVIFYDVDVMALAGQPAEPTPAVTSIDGLTDVATTTTIGVLVDEYVNLGFADHLDFVTGTPDVVVDENAMRRYFRILHDGDEVQFDVRAVHVANPSATHDHLWLELDPYYISNGAITENPNFTAGETYTVQYISSEMDAPTQGAYEDDNNNLAVVAEATFTIAASAPTYTLSATYSPTGVDVVATTNAIVFTFDSFIDDDILPGITVVGATSGAVVLDAPVVSADYMTVTYPINGATPLQETDVYTVTVPWDGFENSLNTAEWPKQGTSTALAFSWTFTTVDSTAPTLAAPGAILEPLDDAINVPLTTDLLIRFDEDVVPVAGKKLYLWRTSSTPGVASTEMFRIDATACTHVGGDSILVPNALFASVLEYDTDYHVTLAAGFVEDAAGNAFAGLSPITTWNFTTGSEPAIAFSAFTPGGSYLNTATPLKIKLSRAATAQVGATYEVWNLTDGISATTGNVLGTDWTTTDGITWTLNGFTPVLGKAYTITMDAGAFMDGSSNLTPAIVAGVIGDGANVATPVWVINYNDTTAPTAVFWPTDGEISIPYNAYLYVKFSEPVALDNGVAIITDPATISAHISSFISLSDGGAIATKVEFVDNGKQVLRITPLDPAGHNYTGDNNPTMQTETAYNLTVLGTAAGFTLTDEAGNAFLTDDTDFTTEDITAPTLSAMSVGAIDANSAQVTFTSDEKGTAYVYIAAGTPSSMTAATVMANAQWTGGVDAATAKTTPDIVLGDTEGAATFSAYVVVVDDETDPYATPDPAMWIFTETSDGVDRIRDILPAPNTSAVGAVGSFDTCDDDLPYVIAKSPAHMAVQVALDANIYITFNEDISYADVVDGYVKLRKASNNAQIPATVTVVDGDSIMINPTANLLQETSYYVEIDRLAISDVAACGPNAGLIEWIGKDDLYFTTVDNTSPVLDTITGVQLTCVDPVGITELIVGVTELNDISVNTASTASVLIYRGTDNTGTLLDVIPVNSGKLSVGTHNDLKALFIDVSHFVFVGEDNFYIEIPAGAVVDAYGNASVNNFFQIGDDGWSFSTLDNIAPEVTWEIHSLNYYFNNSDPGEVGIDSYWSLEDSGDAGEVASNASSHSVLKVDFNEAVQINTNPTGAANWVPLTAYDPTKAASYTGSKTDGALSRGEIFSILNIGSLVYHDTDTSLTDMLIMSVDATSITVGFKVSESALYAAATLGAGSVDYEYADATAEDAGSLALEAVSYEVTVVNTQITDIPACSNTPNMVEDDYVTTIETRDDTAPQLTVSACGQTCNLKDAEIILTFDKPVVKSSYDIVWLDHESHTADNLLLTVANIKDPNYFYIKEVGGSVIALTDVAVDDMQTIRVTPATALKSDTEYDVVFKEWVVKEYIENDPSGALFEGDSCRFRVADYEAPDVLALTPADGSTNMPSTSPILTVTFDEKVMKGSGIVKLRRENGQVFAQLDVNDPKVTITPTTGAGVNRKKVLTLDFSGQQASLEDFTMFYVEMPAGFVTDTVITCNTPNPFEGFDVTLDAGGIVLDADWSFRTSDATPPELLSNEEGDLIGLWPVPGAENVAKNSDLIMTFDENITNAGSATEGLVIYWDNGDDTEVDFGNAIEFIPWNSPLIEISGSDIYNGMTANVVTVDPMTTFDRLGVYYVRVAGNDIFDVAGNVWTDSENTLLDEVKDEEWKFIITNDIAPVLVATTPVYDGVAAPGVYEVLPATDEGFVVADLSMTFEDGNGNALEVARGDDARKVRIYEYIYNPVTLEWDDKLWLEMPITHDSIDFNGNVVTINGVVLRDDIQGDSVYYVTVDPGAVLNGFEGSQTFWAGISNGLRWRFQTGADDVFVMGEPTIVSPENGATNLTIEDASELVIQFGEGIEALAMPGGAVQVWNMDAEPDTLVEAVTVDASMCMDSTLTVPLTQIFDETNFYVMIEAGAFGDTSTNSTPNPAFGGEDVWAFHTGDNTPPVADVAPMDGATCVGSDVTIVLTYDETYGVAINNGMITVADTSGAEIAGVVVGEPMVDEADLNVVTVEVTGLPDTTEIVVTLAEGFVIDGGNNTLPNAEATWSFMTGENTAPTVVSITPELAVAADTVLAITFSEVVNEGTLEGVVTVNGEEVTVTSVDGLVYTAALTDLVSEMTYMVEIAEGAFVDVNAGCTANGIDSTSLEFSVADILAPTAMYYPNLPATVGDYVDVELTIVFDDAVTAEAGNIVIYDAETGAAVDTIDVTTMSTVDDTTYTVVTNELYYGDFYALVDAGSFVDASAADGAKEYAGVADSTEWVISIVDMVFDPCYTIISPLDGAIDVPTTTDLVIEFCAERIVAGTGNVYVADLASDAGDIVIPVVDSLIGDDMMTLTIPVSGLGEMTTYAVTIDPGAILDEAGNMFNGIVDGDLWNFTTVDETAPTVTLVAATITEGDEAEAEITSSEAGTVYLVPEGTALNVAALEAAAGVSSAAGAGVAVKVDISGLAAGTYVAVAVDAAGNVSAASTETVVVEEPIVYPTVTIAEIQGDAAASPLVDQIVTTMGRVTGVNEDGFFLQDANAAWSGVWVYDPDAAAMVAQGYAVKITGTVAEYYDLTEVVDIISIENLASSEVATIVPMELSATDAMAEMYEGVLVKISGLITTELPGEFGEWMTTDSTEPNSDDAASGNPVKIDEQLFAYTPDLGQRYNITGVVNYTFSEYKLAPRMLGDIEFVDSYEMLDYTIDVYPNPFENFINVRVSSNVEITRAVITNIAGQIVKEVNNPDATISTSELKQGVYFISLHTVDGVAKAQRITKR